MKTKKPARKSANRTWLLVLGAFCVCLLLWDFVSGSGKTDSKPPPVLGGDETPGDGEPVGGNEPEENYFIAYRIDRNQVRDKQIEMLDSIVNNPNSDPAAKKAAQDMQITITARMGQELQLENLVKAKGYADAAVFIQDDRITVVVEGELDALASAQIADLAQATTGVSMQKVVVTPKK
ncbi:MAG: SpoIIIAH-like family protein [Clostridiales bacterium]|nr:SpoIIIAH-like family protein [Clostridiales bacterium]